MSLKCFILFLLTFEIELNVGYKGESFPVKYFMPDHQIPEYSDVDYYLQGLNKIVSRFAEDANHTDINGAIGLFYMKTILKRTIRENKNKIKEDQRKLMHSVLLKADYVTSHFFSHFINPLTWAKRTKRTAYLLKEEDLQIDAIGNFKRNSFEKWILSNVSFNEHEQAMDELKMSRETYLNETEQTFDTGTITKYNIHMFDSTHCLSEIIYNPTPWDTKTLRPCVSDKFCSKIVYKQAPSFSYSISHRMLVVMLSHHVRRCYMRSLKADTVLMEGLCSSMYRETVYLARRGYFVRDMLLEHIALCGMHGYEEFFRHHWFRKVVSWIDDQGCIADNFNYEANRTRYLLAKEPNPEEQLKIRKLSKKVLTSPCHWHPMALALAVLAHGIRHAVHFSEVTLKDEL